LSVRGKSAQKRCGQQNSHAEDQCFLSFSHTC
jgi:hypothetical protein